MAEEANRYMSMSPAERERQRALLNQADAAAGAALDVAAAALLKWAFLRLKGADEKTNKLGKLFENIPIQAFPKESTLAKVGGLSETQIENIKKAVLDAVEKAAKI